MTDYRPTFEHNLIIALSKLDIVDGYAGPSESGLYECVWAYSKAADLKEYLELYNGNL